MPGAKQFTEIDANKLRAWMRRRNTTGQELSLAMGASSGYISAAINRGKMSTIAYKALCNTLEVPEDTFIKPMPPEVFTETLEAAPDSEIMERLETIDRKLDRLLALWG